MVLFLVLCSKGIKCFEGSAMPCHLSSFVCHTKEDQKKAPRMKKTGLALVAQGVAIRAVRPGIPRHPWTTSPHGEQ